MDINNTRTPDYSSSQNVPQINELNQTVTPTKPYSTVLSQQQTPKFPSKQQAILFSSIEGIKLQEYLLALGTIVNPKNIIFSSRISNNRICIYLSTKEIVDKFMKEHGTIKVNQEIIHARRLVTPAHRLIMSNVCPTIPHETIENELVKIGLNLLSPTTFLRIGTTNPEYSHILSFRRQVYVAPPTNINIPESFLVLYENTSYRIFLSQDNTTCFKCRQPNHIAAQCPTETSQQQTAEEKENMDSENISHKDKATEGSQPKGVLITENLTEPVTSKKSASSAPSQKRNISDVITPPTQPPTSSDVFPKPDLKTLKKYKASIPSENQKTTEELMRPTKKLFDVEPPPFVLNYQQTIDFFENAYGSSDPLSIAHNYTTNLPALLDMITKLYPYFTERKMKTRCTKIKKKIRRQLEIETTSERESDSSQENYY